MANPYIPGPGSEYNYCQAGLHTDTEVQRVQSRLDDGYTLLQVQVLTRHGDRAPIEYLWSPVYNDTAIWNCKIDRLSYENFDNQYHTQNRLTSERFMPGRQANKGNCGMGSLTQQGARQHVANGQKFRQMYIETAKLLPDNWDNEQVYVRSGNELRLMESAQSVLAGLWPPKENQTQEQRQGVDLIDGDFDNMTPDIIDNCPLGRKLRDMSDSTEKYQEYLTLRDNMEAELDEIFQVKGITVSHMADLIRSRGCHDFDITYGGLLNDTMIRNIKALSLFGFVYFPNHTLANRYGMGSFVQEQVQYFEDHLNGKNDFKFLLFSGHDSSVWPLLDTLGIYDGHWPPLASQVVYEMWEAKNGTNYIEVIYNGRDLTQYIPHCGGGDLCLWDDFLHSTREIRVGLDEFWRECYGYISIPELKN